MNTNKELLRNPETSFTLGISGDEPTLHSHLPHKVEIIHRIYQGLDFIFPSLGPTKYSILHQPITEIK